MPARSRRSDAALIFIVLLVGLSAIWLVGPLRGLGSPPATDQSAEPGGPTMGPASDAPLTSAEPAPSVPTATGAEGVTYHLAPDGSDSDSGSDEDPWSTLEHAAGQLQPGDTLLIANGTYRGQGVDWQTSGEAGRPITIRAAPGARPVFDGEGRGHFLVFRGGAGYLALDGLTVTGYDIEDDGIIVVMDGAHDISFERLTMTGNRGMDDRSHLIYLGAPDVHDIVIAENVLEGIPGGAVHLYHAPNAARVAIRDNILRDNRWGVIVTSEAEDVTIEHNTFVDNEVGVEVWDAVRVSIVENIIVADGHQVAIRLAEPIALVEDRNLFDIDGPPFVIGGDEVGPDTWRKTIGQGSTSLIEDAGLDEDLRPTAGSPAIGAALDGGDLGTRVFP